MKLSETAVSRPILTAMVFVALAVFGIIAHRTIGMAMFPDVDIPVVTVTVQYETSASPETVETEVTEKLEEALSTISGIKLMRSETNEGVSQVFVEFELETDIDVAAQDVRDKLSSIRNELPTEIKEPTVEKFDPDSAPILGIVLSGPDSIGNLSAFADDKLKPALQSIDGVGGVTLAGAREREIRVWLRVDDLKRFNLEAEDVIDRLKEENVELPGGRLETGRQDLTVKTRGKLENVEQFRKLIVSNIDGNIVRLEQVAFIEDGLEDQRSISRLNGKTAISLSIRQQSGKNMVEVADKVKEELDTIRQSILPEGYELLVVQDNAEFVEASVDEAQGELVRGGALAVIVILLFLRSFRGALVVAVTIPCTIISTYAFMLAMGFTLNMMTLLALTISVGMIIDDSIVVLENCWRHMQEGMSRYRAAIAAMNEIGFAVLATSLSICAVFVPVAFMDGLVGRFFYEFGMTVTFAVVVSTAIALTLSPMLCSKILKLGTNNSRLMKWSENGFLKIESIYGRMLDFALRRRFVVLVLAVGIFIGSLFLMPFIGQEFAPVADEGQFSVTVEAPVGSSLEQTSAIALEIEKRLDGLPAIKDIYTRIGGQFDGAVTVAQIVVNMKGKSDRSLSQFDVMNMARERLAAFKHLRISVDVVPRMSGGGFRTAPIQYNLRGNNFDQLNDAADAMMEKLKASDGYVDVNSTSQSGKPEVAITPDQARSSDLTINADQLGSQVNALIGGVKISTFEKNGKNYDVRVRLVGSDRNQLDTIAGLPLRKKNGQLTELRHVASVQRVFGPVSIERQDRERQVTILANLDASKPLGTAQTEILNFQKELELPPGVTSKFTGDAEMMEESFASILFCLFLAIILTYMILSAQFENFLHPFTIMLSLPLSVGGALGGLALTGRSLNIFSMIGMVMLAGLVTKNAILLVDYTNLLRRQGASKDDALRRAGPVRLRPILMTAFSTIAGMTPMVLGLGDGAESRAPMGTCVVGGMITSTLLTLIVIPVVYSLIDDVQHKWVPAIFGYPFSQFRRKENDTDTNGGQSYTSGSDQSVDEQNEQAPDEEYVAAMTASEHA
jgi:hydrophobic/amphiphilic exporter-1 (mainly G- bacteria), HAE1 family